MLKLADNLSLPIDAATQTFAFIARKGAGKTYTAGKVVELLLDAGVQVAILDTVGNWYGLRLSADGKGKGFDIPVLGGLRGDIPLEAAGGALIADILVETGRSLIIDASQFSLSDRKRFATAFGERLWQRKKGERHPSPLHLVIEESQLIVPQFTKGAEQMVGIYEEIIRLGRNYGIGVSMITQRPQSVNKEVLNQTECLLVGQINGAQERDALKKWITHQGMDVHLVDELPTLPVGTFYVWSPQWLQLLERVRILKKRTLDASATPKVGDTREQRELKPLDLTELQGRMKATIEKAKADDPRELRKRIAELERQNKQSTINNQLPTPEAVEKIIEKPVVTDAQLDRLDRLTARVEAIQERQAEQVGKALAGLRAELTAIHGNIKAIVQPRLPLPAAPRHAHVNSTHRSGALPVARTDRPAPALNGSSNEHVSGPQQQILNAMAWLASVTRVHQPKRNQVALVAAVSSVSSGYEKNLSTLRTKGYIEYPGPNLLELTESGAAIAVAPAEVSQDDLHDAIYRRLSTPQAALLKVLIRVYPHALDREEAARRCAPPVSPSSSGFEKNCSTLRTLGLIEYPQLGALQAQPVLFLEAEC